MLFFIWRLQAQAASANKVSVPEEEGGKEGATAQSEPLRAEGSPKLAKVADDIQRKLRLEDSRSSRCFFWSIFMNCKTCASHLTNFPSLGQKRLDLEKAVENSGSRYSVVTESTHLCSE